MTAVNLSMFAGVGAQFFDNNGVPLAGGLLYTYSAGTTTPIATYTDYTGNTANSNPIVLNSAGRTPYEIWLINGSTYKFVLQTATGTTIGSYDNVPSFMSASSTTVSYTPIASGSPTTTVQAQLDKFTGYGNGIYVVSNTVSGIGSLGSSYTGTIGTNTVYGYNNLPNAIGVAGVVCIGANSMIQNKNGENSVAIGNDSLRNIGYDPTTTPVYNTAIGNGAMYVKSTSVDCVAIGSDCFGSFKDNADRATGDVTGVYHDWQGNVNTAGDYVTAVGQNCLTYTSGSYNTGLGCAASVYATTGTYNTSIGFQAGAQGAPSGSGPYLEAGSYNTFLGAQASPTYAARNASYMTAIGYNALVGTSNTIVLGRVGQDVTCIGKTNTTTSAQFTGADLQIGNGIAFGNVNVSGSYVLDWYEELDFSSSITATGITSSGTIVYTGKSTRIGRLVTFNILVYAGGSTMTGTNPAISGLPYAPVIPSVCTSANASTNAGYASGLINTTSVVYPASWTSTAGEIVISGSYIAVA